jgi:hypothetical protein
MFRLRIVPQKSKMALIKSLILTLLAAAGVAAVPDPCARYDGTGTITALLPGANDTNPLCYECPNENYADCNLSKDPLVAAHFKQIGTCQGFGYKIYIKNDPVFVESGLYASA